MIHTWVMIIAVVAIRIMCNSLRDTCFRWISNTSWMERWMCSMVAAASGSLQSHQRSLQTSILIVKGVKMWQKVLLPYLNPLWWFENFVMFRALERAVSLTLWMWRKVLLYAPFFFGQLKEMMHRSDWLQNLMLNAFEACVYNICIDIFTLYHHTPIISYWGLGIQRNANATREAMKHDTWIMPCAKPNLGMQVLNVPKDPKILKDVEFLEIWIHIIPYHEWNSHSVCSFLGWSTASGLRQLSVVEDATRKWSLEQNWNRLE